MADYYPEWKDHATGDGVKQIMEFRQANQPPGRRWTWCANCGEHISWIYHESGGSGFWYHLGSGVRTCQLSTKAAPKFKVEGNPECRKCHGLSATTIPPCSGCGGSSGTPYRGRHLRVVS